MDLYPNEFVILENEINPKHTAIGKYLTATRQIVPLFHQKVQPIYDNLRLLTGPNGEDVEGKVDHLMQSSGGRTIEIEALTYIRGRSIPKQYMIVDEAQNLTPHEVKTIISRAGEGTKVILAGDPYQIDSPYLDASSNGLSYVVERMKGQNIFGHITLTKSERSELASLAANIL